jgi:uncharacterized membrane protein
MKEKKLVVVFKCLKLFSPRHSPAVGAVEAFQIFHFKEAITNKKYRYIRVREEKKISFHFLFHPLFFSLVFSLFNISNRLFSKKKKRTKKKSKKKRIFQIKKQ